MTRQTTTYGSDLNDDELYQGVLVGAKVVPSQKEGWANQLQVDWELKQGGKLRDWMGLGLMLPNKQPTKLRQLLNALAEKPKDTDCWWDPETLEWGYDLSSDDTPAFAVLTPGMAVLFRGETPKDKRYRISAYKALDGKRK